MLNEHPAIDSLHLIAELQPGSPRWRIRKHAANRVAARELRPKPFEGTAARFNVHQHNVAACERERQAHAGPPSVRSLHCLESTRAPVCQGYPTTRWAGVQLELGLTL